MRYILPGKWLLFNLSCTIILLLSGCTTLQPQIQQEPVHSEMTNMVPAQTAAVGQPRLSKTATVDNTASSQPAGQPPTSLSPENTSVNNVALESFTRQSKENKTQTHTAGPAESSPVTANKKISTVPAEEEEGEALVINLEDADIYDVILFFADMLDLNCIVEPDIRGKVTIHTAGKLNHQDMYPLFFQILEANSLTAVKEGNFYRIINVENAPRSPLPLSTDEEDTFGRSGMILQIIPLEHIASPEMVKILTPFISGNGSLVSHDDSNTLLLADSRANIDKILKLVNTFDIDLFSKTSHRFYPVDNADSKIVAQTITEVLSFYGQGSGKIKIINMEKLNSLLVLSDNEKLFAKVAELIEDFDIPSQNVEPHIYLYFLKNSRADVMASLLNSIFTKTTEGEGRAVKNGETERDKEKKQNPFAQVEKKAPLKTTRTSRVDDFGSGTLRGEIKITRDETRNALIIEAIPSDYRIVEKVLKRLDILPRQVLISVTVADVQLDDDMDLGVEWSWSHLNNDTAEHPSFWDAAAGSSGLFYTLGQVDKWHAALTALATQNKVNIISSPSVLASDNKEALINIATEIPVASATMEITTSSEPIIQNDIQYRDTGINLNVTPHINEYGLVSMDVSQEVSESAGQVLVAGKGYPSFFKRSVKTTLTVNSGQTIVIGGLIRETVTDSSAGIPFLSDLPVLGWLFGTTGEGLSKSELIILITPTVVATLDDVDAVTAEFARKVGYALNQQP